MTTDYGLLSADQLLAELEQAGRPPDLDLVRTCLERREELTPFLLDMLAGGVDESWDADDPRWYREVHAGLLLIAFREPAALPIFAEIYRDEERENLIEWFGMELPAYGPALTPMAIELLDDPSAHTYARISSTELLATVALHHPGERERILEALRAYLLPLAEDGTLITEPDARRPAFLWSWAAVALASLRDTVSQPQVIALYEQGLMDESIIGDLSTYLACFEPDARPPLAASYSLDILETYERLHHRAAEEAKWQAEAEQRERTWQPTSVPAVPQTTGYDQPAQPQTYVRSQPKVGRNDPCPCGSGRKYKRCCGKKR